MADPYGVTVSPDGGTLYVTDDNDGLEVFSLPTGELVASLSLSTEGELPGVSPGGSILYAPVAGGTIVALDYLGNIGTIITGGSPSQVVFNCSGTEAYVSDFGNNDVFVINTKTKKIEGQPIQVGLTPFQIVTAAGGKFGFLTTATTGAVDVIKLLK